MIDRELPGPTFAVTAAGALRRQASDAIGYLWDQVRDYGAVVSGTRRARRFGSFGPGSAICFPIDSLVNPNGISIGSNTLIAAHTTLSAGWGPGQSGLSATTLVLGDRVVLGKGSTLTAHQGITIGDDVWTGHGIRITDMNHAWADPQLPIGRQAMAPKPVSIGAKSWLGHGVVVLPGVTIGRFCVIGANAVVTKDVPDCSIAVGVPARIVGSTQSADSTLSMAATHLRH